MGINSQRNRMILSIVLAALIFAAFAFFARSNMERIRNQNAEYLYELTTQRAESIDSIFKNNISFIRSTAYLYGETMKGKKVDIDTLREFEENSAFEALRFVDAKGHDYTSEGIRANVLDLKCFKEGMRGHSGIDFITRSKVNGERQIVFYAPVYNGNKVIGVMLGIFGKSSIYNLIDYELFGLEGESWLCDREGRIIGSTKRTRFENYFEYLEKSGESTEEELNNIRKVFLAGGNASLSYKSEGERTDAYAANINSSGWILIRSFPASATSHILSMANRNGAFLILFIIMLFAAYMIIMTMGYDKQQEQLEAERSNAEYISGAMTSLLEKVIKVDLKTGRYEYIIGRPNDSSLGIEGDYNEYCSSLLSQVSDADNYRTVAKLIRLENLIKIMSIQDVAIVNIRSHVNGHVEYYSYKYAMTKKEDGTAAEVFIITQDVTHMIPEEY